MSLNNLNQNELDFLSLKAQKIWISYFPSRKTSKNMNLIFFCKLTNSQKTWIVRWYYISPFSLIILGISHAEWKSSQRIDSPHLSLKTKSFDIIHGDKSWGPNWTLKVMGAEGMTCDDERWQLSECDDRLRHYQNYLRYRIFPKKQLKKHEFHFLPA